MRMKKIFLVLAAMFCVATVSAQSKWAAGLRIGSGLQAQGEYAYSDNCYVEARFGMSWVLGGVTADFQALHNWNVGNWDWTPSVGKWFLDAGCGLNVGGREYLAYYGVAGQVKFGLKFNKVPIRLAVDYTPVIGGITAYWGGFSASGFHTRGLANVGISAVYCF